MALKALENWREPADEGREKNWYRIEDKDSGPTQINIFDEISWWGISAEMFAGELAQIKGDIEVHINSPGGDVFDGITIYNLLAARKGGVTTVVDGLAASAASVIFMAGKKRLVSPGSMVMIHDALCMTIGNEADHLESARLLAKTSDSVAGIYATGGGKTSAEWRAVMVAEGWFTAEEAVTAGIAHELAARPDDDTGSEQAAAAAFDRSIFANWHGVAATAAAPEPAVEPETEPPAGPEPEAPPVLDGQHDADPVPDAKMHTAFWELTDDQFDNIRAALEETR
jgi:ATP-dependent protease ClpP protease subunit